MLNSSAPPSSAQAAERGAAPRGFVLPAIVLLLLAVGWRLAAGRLLLHGGDVHQALDDSTCLSGDATWAAVQGTVAALGILALLATAVATARAGRGGALPARSCRRPERSFPRASGSCS